MARPSKLSIGDTIGGLFTVKDVFPQNTTGRHTKYLVVCKMCQSETIKTLSTLQKARSCGCQKHNSSLWKSIGAKNRSWQLTSGEAAFNNLYTGYKNRALRSGKDFELSHEYFRQLTKQVCYYCGTEPSQISKGLGKTSGDYIYNGIDRVDSSKGYTQENTVSCCKTCNFMKLDHSQENFLQHIKKIYNKNYVHG